MKFTLPLYGLLLCAAMTISFDQEPIPVVEKPVIKTKTGLISGVTNPGTGVSSYKGIPYAQAPIGDLRWRAPQPAKPWQNLKVCDAFGPSPYQNKPGPFSMWSQEFITPEQPINEDCLYLNVWAAAKGKKPKPVLVWIYGGGFGSGGSNVPVYDGEALAAKGIVSVSFNYRVGVFGFMAHPALSAESGHQASGNYGLMDQIAALKWVKDNIAAFGGDPDQVTIAGQSAGSMSVSCLMAAPAAKKMFSKAIAESGSYVLNHTGIEELRTAEQQGLAIAEKLQAKTLAELRAAPASAVQRSVVGNFKPIVDGYILPEAVGDCFAAGRQHQVPLLTGWNADEIYVAEPIKTVQGVQEKLKKQYGDKAEILLNYYHVTDESSAIYAQRQLATAERYGMQNFTLANLQSKIPGLPVYVYRFYRKVPGNGEYAKFGAFHTSEVPYAYHNLRFSDRPWQAVDYNLEKQMSDSWINFIVNGDPNRQGMARWGKYDQKNYQVMVFDEEIQPAALAEKELLQVIVAAQAVKAP